MVSATESNGERCHALVLSGGGVNGAWEAGVIYGLTHYGNPENYQWDVVTGVSAGAINSAGLGVWAPGEEVEGSENLAELWSNLKSEDVYV